MSKGEEQNPVHQDTGGNQLDFSIPGHYLWHIRFVMEQGENAGELPGEEELGRVLDSILEHVQETANRALARSNIAEAERPSFDLGYDRHAIGPLEDDEGGEPFWLLKIEVTDVNPGNRDAVNEVVETVNQAGRINNLVRNVRVFSVQDSLGRALNGNNWGGGGPGGLPIPPSQPISTTSSTFNLPDPFDPSIGFTLEDLRTNDGGKNAVVAILDTCPTTTEWSKVVDQFTNSASNPPNPLIAALNNLYQSGKFRLITDTMTPQHEALIDQAMQGLPVNSYDMIDHGLFVAGIVHAIAPQAHILLFRVLNDQGIGTLGSVGNGFGAARRYQNFVDPSLKGLPHIINCSLSLELLPDSIAAMELIWGSIVGRDIGVTAAGGNEGYGSVHPPVFPAPRFPAKFDFAFGVSSLSKGGKRPKYANWGDDFGQPGASPTSPPRRGAATIGGEVVCIGQVPTTDIRTTNPDDGILGVYTRDNYPLQVIGGQPVPNDTGWALWAGTSFATPVISGVMALIASHMCQTAGTKPTREAVLQKLLEYCGQNNRLQEQVNGNVIPAEHILSVTQG